jgi:hypothetical protein
MEKSRSLASLPSAIRFKTSGMTAPRKKYGLEDPSIN